MLWKYTLFQLKILLKSNKQWILGIVIILFFPIYYSYYQNIEPPTALGNKEEEKLLMLKTLDLFPDEVRETKEGKEVYDNLTSQLSLINMQIFYISTEQGKKEDNYIEDGLALNKLRMEMHDMDNSYVPEYFVIPKEEIKKDNDLLLYLQQHEITIEDNPYVTSQFMVSAFSKISGVALFGILLLLGSNMLAYERNHQTMLKLLPISFVKKSISKVGLQIIYVLGAMIVGICWGVYRSASTESIGNLAYPMMIYTNNGFEIVPVVTYLLNVFLAIVIICIMILSLTLLLEIVFQNAYATIIIGIALYFIPNVFQVIGIKAKILYPLKYTNIISVMSGEFARDYGGAYIDYWHSILWMIVFTIIIILILFIQNKLSFRRNK